MNAAECRERARQCRVNASRAWGKLQISFEAAAASWDALGNQYQKLEATRSTGVLAVKAKAN